ncbi:MAG: PQQ-binding-like beta-propeller repeat protein [Vicinamibacteria bacterium]
MSRAASPLRALTAALVCAGCGGARIEAPPRVFPLAIAWTAPLGSLPEDNLATDGARIFVSTRDGRLRALAPDTGAVLWQVELAPGSLAARPGLLLVHHRGGDVVRVEPESGVVRWRAHTQASEPLPPAASTRAAFVAGATLDALDLINGRLLWSRPIGARATAPVALLGERVLVGASDGALRAFAAEGGALAWTHETGGGALRAAPIEDADGRLLLGTAARSVVALRARDGDRLWRWKLGTEVRSEAALLGGQVLVASYESVLWAFSRRSGSVSWRAPLPSRPRSAPLLVGSAVLVACYETDLVGFDGRNGKRLGALKLPATFATSALVVGDRLFVGLRGDGAVVAIDVSAKAPPSPGPSPAPGTSPSASPAGPQGSPPAGLPAGPGEEKKGKPEPSPTPPPLS